MRDGYRALRRDVEEYWDFYLKLEIDQADEKASRENVLSVTSSLRKTLGIMRGAFVAYFQLEIPKLPPSALRHRCLRLAVDEYEDLKSEIEIFYTNGWGDVGE
jgi:hypothetical protein